MKEYQEKVGTEDLIALVIAAVVVILAAVTILVSGNSSSNALGTVAEHNVQFVDFLDRSHSR